MASSTCGLYLSHHFTHRHIVYQTLLTFNFLTSYIQYVIQTHLYCPLRLNHLLYVPNCAEWEADTLMFTDCTLGSVSMPYSVSWRSNCSPSPSLPLLLVCHPALYLYYLCDSWPRGHRLHCALSLCPFSSTSSSVQPQQQQQQHKTAQQNHGSRQTPTAGCHVCTSARHLLQQQCVWSDSKRKLFPHYPKTPWCLCSIADLLKPKIDWSSFFCLFCFVFRMLQPFSAKLVMTLYKVSRLKIYYPSLFTPAWLL